MPNYEAHLTAGALFGVLFAVAVWSTLKGFMPDNQAIGIATMQWVVFCAGSIAPDVDHHSSKPRKLFNFYTIIGLALAVPILALGGLQGVSSASALEIFMAAIVGITVLTIARYSVPPIVQAVMPPHRTLTHLPPFWIFVSVLAIPVWHGTMNIGGVPRAVEVAVIAPGLIALAGGAMVHIFLDGAATVSKIIQRYQMRRRSPY